MSKSLGISQITENLDSLLEAEKLVMSTLSFVEEHDPRSSVEKMVDILGKICEDGAIEPNRLGRLLEASRWFREQWITLVSEGLVTCDLEYKWHISVKDFPNDN